MGQYYKNSWLTIGAGFSENVSQGFLCEREQPKYYRLQSLQRSKICFSNLYFTSEPLRENSRSLELKAERPPLFTRGWTLQEDMLSTRFLSFEYHQVYFRSGNLVTSESGHRSSTEIGWPAETELVTTKLWSDIIREYSKRNLTQGLDKLPALSGLAHEYQAVTGDRYLAGMWESELPFNLLWHRFPDDIIPEPSCGYRAPSWSWAAVDGYVSTDYDHQGNPDANLLVNFKVKDVSVELAGSDPMGRVSDASLTVLGKLRKGRCDLRPLIGAEINHKKFRLFDAQGILSSMSFQIYFDRDLSPEEFDIWYLPILRKGVGLALRPKLGQVNTYERIGYIKYNNLTSEESHVEKIIPTKDCLQEFRIL